MHIFILWCIEPSHFSPFPCLNNPNSCRDLISRRCINLSYLTWALGSVTHFLQDLFILKLFGTLRLPCEPQDWKLICMHYTELLHLSREIWTWAVMCSYTAGVWHSGLYWIRSIFSSSSDQIDWPILCHERVCVLLTKTSTILHCSKECNCYNECQGHFKYISRTLLMFSSFEE